MAAPIETRIGDSMVRFAVTLFWTAAIQAGSSWRVRASAVSIGITMAWAAAPLPVRKPPTAANNGTPSAAPRPAAACSASAIAVAMPEPT